MWDKLRGYMLLSLKGYEVRANNFETPNHRCIIPLIGYVRDAGAFFHHLLLKLSSCSPRTSKDLVPALDSRPVFSSGMQRLKTLSFSYNFPGHNMSDDEDDDGNQDDDDIRQFLSARMDTASLQSVSLEMRESDEEGIVLLRFGEIINKNMSFHKLTQVVLHDFSLDYADLIVFLRRLPKPMEYFHVSRVRLHNGPWRNYWMHCERKVGGAHISGS